MTKEIEVNGPEHRGAPMPPYDPLKFNESKFLDAERGKEWNLVIDFDNKICEVEWLSQESSTNNPSDKFIEELQRVLIANGAKLDFTLDLKFGSRDDGYVYERVETLKDF